MYIHAIRLVWLQQLMQMTHTPYTHLHQSPALHDECVLKSVQYEPIHLLLSLDRRLPEVSHGCHGSGDDLVGGPGSGNHFYQWNVVRRVDLGERGRERERVGEREREGERERVGEGESGRGRERERGRVGEGERGREGERERGREGERVKGSLVPRPLPPSV